MENSKLAIIMAIIAVPFAVNEWRFITFGPFGTPLYNVTMMNCGPEHRYHFPAYIQSKEDLTQFITDYYHNLTNHYGSEYLRIYTYAGNNTWLPPEEVDWTEAMDDTTVDSNGAILFYQTVYTIRIPCLGHINMRITQYGYVSIYGCCGI